MDNTTSTAFPAFPSLYTEEDAKRFEEVSAQKAAMEKAYSLQFKSEVWEETSPFEKVARTFINNSSILGKVASVFHLPQVLTTVLPQKKHRSS
jgi:hypothetical protein